MKAIPAGASLDAAEGVNPAELADRKFHLLIAHATQNNAIVAAVEALWGGARAFAATQILHTKAQATGLHPGREEHAAIAGALRSRSADAARQAMRRHLTRAMQWMLAAREIEQIEEARARTAATREKYAAGA